MDVTAALLAGPNPFAALTFIAAPALLTNASSLLLLGTTNRLARAVDRVRAVVAQLDHLAARRSRWPRSSSNSWRWPSSESASSSAR